MLALLTWLSSIKDFLTYWFQESWKEAVKVATSFWGLIIIAAGLLYTLATHILPMLSFLLDTINGLATGNFNFTPPALISNVLAIANTLCPMDELMAYATAYGILKATLALYRFVKTLIPTEAGV